ncbi:hypothetical protein J4234_00430 [Candidatus Woesearchaeota archaeon]|nr:hypothetical protein [Candidatus Woesearchaeota archaeon]
MKQKSQITMLMIVGLVLFIIVSLVLYLSKSAAKKQSLPNIKRVQETSVDASSMKEFVSKCLDKLAKDAIVLLGKQGGYIYTSQGGPLVDYQATDEGLFFVKYNNLNVAYNILQPRFAVPPYSSEIPDYPWTTFPYRTAASNAEIFEGFFGMSNIPPLNSSEGPNSIQTQLEAFIDSNMKSCANPDIFKSQGLEITIGKAKTSVTIEASDITVKLEIPIKITNTATNEIMELKDFSTVLDVGIRDAHSFIKELIQNDIKNTKFNISGSKNYKVPASIKIVKDIFSNDDMIIVTDENLLVYGRPFEYIFARKNRAPALYYIKKNTLEFSQGYEIKKEDLLKSYELKAEDPDEDSLAFSFYIGESGKNQATFPKKLEVLQLKFRVEVSDGKLSDHQVVIVNRK